MCACKGNSSSRQVSKVKRVVKTPQQTYSSPNTQTVQKRTQKRQIIFKRHM